jgi:hypothetical protein
MQTFFHARTTSEHLVLHGGIVAYRLQHQTGDTFRHAADAFFFRSLLTGITCCCCRALVTKKSSPVSEDQRFVPISFNLSFAARLLTSRVTALTSKMRMRIRNELRASGLLFLAKATIDRQLTAIN